MRNYRDHLITHGSEIKKALEQLNELALDAILFVVDSNGKLLGSLTDGDIRRGLLKERNLEDKVESFIEKHPKFIRKDNYQLQDVLAMRDENIRIIHVLDEQNKIANVINFRFLASYLPLDAVIMAGGRGSRLKPLTDTVPKPLLEIAGKPIIDHTVDRLLKYGIDDILNLFS